MSVSSRPLVIGLLLLLVGGIGFAIWTVRDTAPPAHTVAQPEKEKDSGLTGENVSFLVTEGERKKWKISAKKAFYNDAHSVAQLTDIQGEFYNASGQPILKFQAPKGQYLNKNNAVELSGGAVAKSVEATDPKAPQKASTSGISQGELKAPKMVWNAKTDRVTASGGVVLSFPHGVSRAQACKFNLDFSVISFSGNVASTLKAL
jgi:LPS export ABC transporter protein LptC